MLEKSELTTLDLQLLNESAKQKNQVDENNMLHITPLMTSMFSDGKDVQYIKNFTEKGKSLFKSVSIEEAPSRILTAPEFNAFPEKDRDPGKIPGRALLRSLPFIFVFIIITVLWVPGLISGIRDGFNSGTAVFTVIFLVAALAVIIAVSGNIRRLKDILIKTDSKVAAGKVSLFYIKHGRHGSLYYIDIAFYDEKKIVKKVNCSEDFFKNLSFDSDVYIINDNLYAYGKNGKLTANI